MSRIKIARQIISYLEEKINCDNVMNFADKYNAKQDNTKKLMVNDVPVNFEIITYNDHEKKSKTDENDSSNDNKNSLWIKKMFGTYDFITEANYVGFEFFPYIYGVLNCHGGDDSRVYVFYEYFANNLIHLINNIQHPSEWYDIAFQIIMINYCIVEVNGFEYNGVMQNHLYKKLEKPYYKNYELNGKLVKINHKYLIVLWMTNPIKKINNQNTNFTNNIDFLLQYLSEKKDQIKIPPSNKIIKLLSDVKNNPSDVPDIILKYYGQTERDN